MKPSGRAVLDVSKPWTILGAAWAVGALFVFLYSWPLDWSYLRDALAQMSDFRILHPYLLHVLFGFFIGLVLLVIGARGGALLIQKYSPEAIFTKSEAIVFGSAIGFGVMAYATLLLGLLHLWYAGAFLIALGVWSVCGMGTHVSSALPGPLRESAWTPLWKAALFVLAVLYALGAAAPEIFYDSLHYHLAVPALYRLQHGITAIPTMLYAGFVMSVQWVYGLAITLGNTFSAKIIHVSFCVLLVMAYVASSRRFFNSTSGWLAAAFFLSMPMVAINATTAGTDVAGAFLLVASTGVFVMALERRTVPLFRLAGALTGIAASVKYPAFVFIPIASVLLIWHFAFDEKETFQTWKSFLVQFLISALLFLSPVLLKNEILQHNPIYPFGGTFLGYPRLDPLEWNIFLADTMPRDLYGVFSSLSGFGRWVIQPWYVSLGSRGTVGPLLLMGLPFLFRRSKGSLAFRTLRRYCVFLWISWLFTSTVPRYALPSMALACPLLAEALLSAAAEISAGWVFLGTFGIGIFANIALQLMILFSWGGWRVVAGQESQEAYLRQSHPFYPNPPYEALHWMNQNLPSNATVLFAGESRGYYLERRSIPSSIPGPQPIVVWSHQAKTAAALAQKMRSEGVTHVFLNLLEARRAEGYHEFQWDPASWAVLDDFWRRNMRLIWKQENHNSENPQALYVFELVPESIAAQPHVPTGNPFIDWKPH